MWRWQGPKDCFAGSSLATRAPWWGALLYHGVRWSSEASGAPRWRETASGFGLNQWQSVEKCGLSRSSWIQVGVFDKKSAEVFRASWLATEAVGSLGMQRSHFLQKRKIGPLQIRAISPLAQSEACAGSGPGLLGRFGGDRPRDNRRSISSSLHTKNAQEAQHQSAASAPRRRAPSKRPNRRS